MKYIIFIALLALSSTVSFAKDHDEPNDANCQKMAENARGFADLKQGGIATTEDDLEKFVVSPTVQSYPIKSVLEYVMAQDGKTPQQVYDSLYHRCVLMGYNDLLAYFTERESVDRLNVALNQRDELIAQLRQQIASLQQENTELKYPQEQHHVHIHRVVKQPVVVPVQPAVKPSPPVASNRMTYGSLPYGCTKADGSACSQQ